MSTLFQVSKKFSAIWRCEPVPNGIWPKHFSFYFQPLSRTFSVPKVSVPKYFGDLFSLWKVQQAGIIPRPMAHEYPALCTRPLQHKKCCIITENNENVRYSIFAEQTRKWKISAYLPNYSGEQKGVQEKYLNMVVKINRVYWLKTEKKPAYGRKKNYGQ